MNVQTDIASPDENIGEKLQGVVAIGRRRYAVSLIWNQAEGNKSLTLEAKEAADRMGCSLFAIRPGKGRWHDQFAVADRNLKHKAGLPSLAAALADELSSSILGAWQLGEGIWWLVGIRDDGLIIYDRAVSDVQDIQQDFLEALASGEWTQVLCPAEWGVNESEQSINLAGNIGKGKIFLRPTKVNKVRIASIFSAVALAILASLFSYKKYQEHLLELKQIEERQKKLSGMYIAKDIQVPPMPWAGKPIFNLALISCVTDLVKYAEYASQIPAWERGTGTCNGNEIDYTLKSSGGTEIWLNIMAERLPVKPSSASASGETGNIVWKLPEIAVYPDNSPGVSLQKTQQYLTVELAELFIPITFSGVQKELFWLKMEYKVENVQELPYLLKVFSKIPASVVKSVTFDPVKRLWSLEAEVYERRKPTPEELEELRNKQ